MVNATAAPATPVAVAAMPNLRHQVFSFRLAGKQGPIDRCSRSGGDAGEADAGSGNSCEKKVTHSVFLHSCKGQTPPAAIAPTVRLPLRALFTNQARNKSDRAQLYVTVA